MNDYSKKILKVPTVTFVREQDQGKQPVLDVRNLGIDFGGLTAVDRILTSPSISASWWP